MERTIERQNQLNRSLVLQNINVQNHLFKPLMENQQLNLKSTASIAAKLNSPNHEFKHNLQQTLRQAEATKMSKLGETGSLTSGGERPL